MGSRSQHPLRVALPPTSHGSHSCHPCRSVVHRRRIAHQCPDPNHSSGVPAKLTRVCWGLSRRSQFILHSPPCASPLGWFLHRHRRPSHCRSRRRPRRSDAGQHPRSRENMINTPGDRCAFASPAIGRNCPLIVCRAGGLHPSPLPAPPPPVGGRGGRGREVYRGRRGVRAGEIYTDTGPARVRPGSGSRCFICFSLG